MQDTGTSVDSMHAKQSSLLGNHNNLGKGSALRRNGPRGLSGGEGKCAWADCFTQHALISLSKVYWQTTLSNLDKADLIKML